MWTWFCFCFRYIFLVISYNNPFWRSSQIFCVLGCLFLLLFFFAFSAVIKCLFNWQITELPIITAPANPLVLKTKQFETTRSISVTYHKVTLATLPVCDWLLMAAGALSHLRTPSSSYEFLLKQFTSFVQLVFKVTRKTLVLFRNTSLNWPLRIPAKNFTEKEGR